MTIIELTPAELINIIKASTNSSAKVAEIDLNGFLNKIKEQFAEVTKPFYEETAADEFEEKTGEYGKCCLPHNHSPISKKAKALSALELDTCQTPTLFTLKEMRNFFARTFRAVTLLA